jgi:probable rRNA maturation factor
LLLSNNKNIKKLNKNFRNKNKSTDILSFPLDKKIKISKKNYLGDIIISYNFIDKPRSQDLKLFKEKVVKIFIHGFLHLLGFDHIKNKDYVKMLKEENFIYKSVKSKIN